MKYCGKCGKELSDAARCCNVCGGAPVDAPPAQPVQPSAAVSGNSSVSGIWKLFYPANIIGMVGCFLVLVSTFFTFASVSFWGYKQSVALIEGTDGKLFLAAAVIGVVLCFVNKPIMPIVNLVYSCLLALLSVYETSDMDSTVGELGALSSVISRGAGYYLLIFGAVVYLVAAVCAVIAKKMR